MNKRDEFSKKTIEILAKRVGYLCSNPDCRKSTVGPNSEENKSLSIGVAAHITAASQNGPRYDKKINSEKRRSLRNAIWLCQSCSVLIDKDTLMYNPALLKNWKRHAESVSRKMIEGGKNDLPIFSLFSSNINNTEHALKFRYSKDKGFFCEIKNDEIKYEIFFNYFLKENEWNEKESELKSESPFYFTFLNFRKWLENEIKIKTKEEFVKLLDEINFIIKEKGANGIAEYLFDLNNINDGIPKYSDFINAFEFFSGQKRSEFYAEVVGSLIYFRDSNNNEYVLDTYEGKTKELKAFIERKSYDEIYGMTDLNIWSDIYVDCGIEKEIFIPKMLRNWEDYWDNRFRKEKERGGSTRHLETEKDRSWRQFRIFSDGYNDAGDVIRYSWEFDDFIFYPLAVITMLETFDPKVCYDEYCELEFYAKKEWTSISINESDDGPFFYVKLNEAFPRSA